MNNNSVFIAIEGPIGVGKTTLSKILRDHFNYQFISEIVEENPFISKFYADMDSYALQTEAFFLFNRIKQLEDIECLLKKGKGVVSDYHIIKNLIFAGMNLNSKQFHKYKQVYNLFVDNLTQPDIIIYLNSDIDVLMNRIATRDRSFEREMNVKYITRLRNEYKYYFDPISIKYNFPGKKPVIIEIDNSNLDFLKNEKDRKDIIQTVEKAINMLGGENNV